MLVNRVFVYGTLKPGGHYWEEYCERKVSEIAPAKVRGRLYDLGVGYPGAIFGGDTWIEGYVLSFQREQDFWRLDKLEGYASGRAEALNEYNRLKVPCFSLCGSKLEPVWAYEMTQSTRERYNCILIESGVWLV